MSEKIVVYQYEDPGEGWLTVGDIENLWDWIKPYYQELENGVTIEIAVRRQDMTQAEFDALPEV